MSYLKSPLPQLTENDILNEGENEFVVGEKDVRTGTGIAEGLAAYSTLISVYSCNLSINIYKAPNMCQALPREWKGH